MSPLVDGQSTKQDRRSWGWIAGTSGLVSLIFVGLGSVVTLSPTGILAALFVAGFVAGAVSSRQAWLSGIIVGIPLGVAQLTRHALVEYANLSVAWARSDFWIFVLPVAVVSTGVAILGGLSGAYALGERFRPR